MSESMVAPEASLADKEPLYNQPLFHPLSVPVLPPLPFSAGPVKKVGEGYFCFNPLTILLPRCFCLENAFGFWFQTEQSFCWKNNHLLAAQLVTSFLWLAGESIIIRQFSLWGERSVICSSVRVSKEGEKYPFSDGFVSEHPTQWRRKQSLPRMAGLLVEIRDERASPDIALQLVLCTRPQQASIMSLHGRLWDRNWRVGRENLHILYTLPLSPVSAMCPFFLSFFFSL